MTSDKREIGIYQIYIGDVPSDGVTQPAYSAMDLIGHNIKTGSISPGSSTPQFADILNQEDMSVDMTVYTGVENEPFVFGTWDYNFENLINVMGGSVVGSEWVAPTTAYAGKEVCLVVISAAAKGMHLKKFYPKVKMYGKMADGGSNEEPGNVEYSFNKLSPTDASGVKTPDTRVEFIPAAPTNPQTDDTANTFEFDTVDGFSDVTKYEYSINGGTAYNDVTVNPITGITTAVPVGDLLVRVKTNTATAPQYGSGFDLANTEAFTE